MTNNQQRDQDKGRDNNAKPERDREDWKRERQDRERGGQREASPMNRGDEEDDEELRRDR